MVAEAMRSLRISKDPALGSGPAQPCVPSEVGKYGDVVGNALANTPIWPFEGIGFGFIGPGHLGRAARGDCPGPISSRRSLKIKFLVMGKKFPVMSKPANN
jgi:hypothetical protein